jgi:hypothetical protein
LPELFSHALICLSPFIKRVISGLNMDAQFGGVA